MTSADESLLLLDRCSFPTHLETCKEHLLRSIVSQSCMVLGLQEQEQQWAMPINPQWLNFPVYFPAIDWVQVPSEFHGVWCSFCPSFVRTSKKKQRGSYLGGLKFYASMPQFSGNVMHHLCGVFGGIYFIQSPFILGFFQRCVRFYDSSNLFSP